MISLMVFAAAASSAFGAPSAQTLTVVDEAGVSPLWLARVERAIVDQVNQARTIWPALPTVTFGEGGWSVALYTPQDFKIRYPSLGMAGGVHYLQAGLPTAAVEDLGPWPSYLSHEVLEMLADPGGQGQEIADPAEKCNYELDGVQVSDFATPRWFGDRRGRLDWANALSSNGDLHVTLGGRCVPMQAFNLHPNRYLIYLPSS